MLAYQSLDFRLSSYLFVFGEMGKNATGMEFRFTQPAEW